ncbi:exocyst complex component EXO70H1-like [Vicia villosa]|uniref:exocyst complex component EXO70H1-like n=1 Tax=Vicia villosa TaxID=3911 RepID=UPI00273A78CF|nr:exocyst complex component EXO70H1-like [Vicia villosa]
MKIFCLNPKTPSFSIYRNSSPSSISSSSTTTTPSIRKATARIEAAKALISKWNSETSDYAKVTSLFYVNKDEAIQYIQCVNHLQRAMHSLLKLEPFSQKLIHAQNLMQIAMKRLQKEFYQILSANRAHLDPESVGSSDTSFSSYDYGGEEKDTGTAAERISEVERVSCDMVDDLRIIADCMVSNGYAKECVKVYTKVRKSIIDESIYKLNVEERSFSKVNKMDWKILEMKIKSWLEAVRISVRTLFIGERNFCDGIFASRSMREACFGEISRDGAILLFRFPELVTKSKKSMPDMIFLVLDMYTAITVLLPEIESIFLFDSTAAVKSQAYNSQQRLAESVRKILSEFEYTMLKNTSKLTANLGEFHSLTTRTMQYLTRLADYNHVLSEIFLDIRPSSMTSALPESYSYSLELSNNMTDISIGFSVQMTRLIEVLLSEIDRKSNQCMDLSLCYLCLANNLWHVVEKIRATNLQDVLGDDWLLRHISKVKRLMENYERVAWDEVFSSLPENPTTISVAEVRGVFMKFSLEFERAYQKQNSFVVPESEFREDIRASLERKLIPIYRELYDTYGRIMAGRSLTEMNECVVFTPEDVQKFLGNLFSCGKV